MLSTTEVTPELLAMIAGVLISLATSYIPRFNAWFKNLGVDPSGNDDGNLKRLMMAGFLLLGTGLVFVIVCVPAVSMLFAAVITFEACTSVTVGNILTAFVLSIIANQGAYGLSPRVAIRTPLRAMKQPDDAKG